MAIDPDEEETAVWQRVLEALLARGHGPSEAMDGANLLLLARRRRREDGGEDREAASQR